jgi:molecular chaperone DnaJ
LETKDLYKALGISKEASQDEIRRAYRKLARKYHPDANPDDPKAEDHFKDIQHAYEVLSDPEKRRQYDEKAGSPFFSSSQNRGDAGTNFTSFTDFSDVFGSFGDIFGRSGRDARATTRRGEDITVSVNLKFIESLNGVTTKVSVPVEEGCGECGGSGAAPGSSPRSCSSCGGGGVRSRDQGFFALSESCGRCGGSGVVIDNPCAVCGGGGRVKRSRQVSVRIPAGVKDGSRIRVPGRGGAGARGGPAGDLYVVTRVEEHPLFERSRDDFLIEVPVNFTEAALGSEIEVPRPEGGTVKLKLPAGSQSGKQLKVSGAGAPSTRDGEKGNLIVKVKVVVPQKLTRRQREILEAFAEEREEDVREDLLRRA